MDLFRPGCEPAGEGERCGAGAGGSRGRRGGLQERRGGGQGSRSGGTGEMPGKSLGKQRWVKRKYGGGGSPGQGCVRGQPGAPAHPSRVLVEMASLRLHFSGAFYTTAEHGPLSKRCGAVLKHAWIARLAKHRACLGFCACPHRNATPDGFGPLLVQGKLSSQWVAGRVSGDPLLRGKLPCSPCVPPGVAWGEKGGSLAILRGYRWRCTQHGEIQKRLVTLVRKTNLTQALNVCLIYTSACFSTFLKFGCCSLSMLGFF